MISKIFLMLIVPGCVFSYITIDIKASKHNFLSKIKYKGSATGVIGPREEQLFQITQEKLSSAINSVIGKRPDHIFLHEPTPWNVYSTYDWSQVKWISRPLGSRLKTVLVEPVVLKSDVLRNSETKSAWDVSYVLRNPRNNVSMTWDNGGGTNSLRDVSYNVTVDGDFASQIQGWSSWGIDDQISGAPEIDPHFFRPAVLQPGETLEASLVVNKISVEFEVEFWVKLKGRVAVNYSERYRGHHFWAIDILALQLAQHLPKRVHLIETIKIDFFSDGRINFKTQPQN